jgi:hypothetical protein
MQNRNLGRDYLGLTEMKREMQKKMHNDTLYNPYSSPIAVNNQLSTVAGSEEVCLIKNLFPDI